MESILVECKKCLNTMGPVIDDDTWTHLGCTKCGASVPRPSMRERVRWEVQKAAADKWRKENPEEWAKMVEEWR